MVIEADEKSDSDSTQTRIHEVCGMQYAEHPKLLKSNLWTHDPQNRSDEIMK